MTESQSRKPELIETNTIRLKTLSIPELCTKYNCDMEELPELLNKTAKDLFLYATKNEGSYSPDLDENIETIFLLYHATREMCDIDKYSCLSEITNQLNSLDDFLKSQGQEYNLQLRAELISRIHIFMENYGTPSSEITATSFPLRGLGFPEKYFMEGKWLRVTPPHEKDIVDYARPDVISELITLIETGKTIISDYTHSTLSPALNGIAKHHAITSGEQTILRGDTITTGEDTFYVTKEGTPITGGKRGHKYIFADTGVQASYGQHRWFNEFPLAFGMSQKDIFENLKKEGVDLRIHDQMLGDGYIIGSVFDLDKVSHIYVKSTNLTEIKRWAQINTPNAVIISLEAVSLFYRYFKTNEQSKKLTLNDLKTILSSDTTEIK